MICFVCDTEFNPAKTTGRRCPSCHRQDCEAVPEEDPRFLVLESMVRRALGDGELADGWQGERGMIRLVPSGREYAMLKHGDQCKIEGVLWRITAKNEGVFWMRGWKVGKTMSGRTVEAGVTEDLNSEIEQAEVDEARWAEERLRRMEQLRLANSDESAVHRLFDSNPSDVEDDED